jgi:chloride channel 3/4/5
LSGYLRQIVDASQIWLVLIATGLATGAVAAFIDVASDWLGDLKSGVCGNVVNGGRFYLNRSFCCWGYDGNDAWTALRDDAILISSIELAKCQDWRPWSAVLHVFSAAGSWIIEYLLFIVFSVSIRAIN